MAQTIAQKIIAKHAGVDLVKPGEIYLVNVDFAFGNDITAALSIKQFNEIGAKKVFDPDKIGLIPDHYTPNKDIKTAIITQSMRNFAKEHGITHHYEVGEVGIEHALLPEKGVILPGDLVIGADSHTCTYGALGAFSTGVGSTDLTFAWITGKVWLKVPETIKFVINGKLPQWSGGKDIILYIIGKIGVNGANYRVMEFSGDTIKNLNMDNRFTICNMAIEAGAKTGIIEPDEKTIQYVEERKERSTYTVYKSDDDADYERILEINAEDIVPQVAFPHLPENTRPIYDVEKMDIRIDQAVIGSCTNGRISDLEIAAKILKGHKVADKLRLIILPATPAIYHEALKRGYIETFLEAGAVIAPPTCGPCLGGHMGVLAPGEKAISTTNRNFRGRMGHVESEVYLSNPAVAAASAIAGKIVSPEYILGGN